MDKKAIKESKIPLEVFYNDKIERIRAMEQSVGSSPQAIKFQILESLKNKPTHKHIKLVCVSAPKPYQFEIDLTNQPLFIESDFENYNR
jgi:hypothetical protein